MSIADRRALIDPGHPALSILRQCALVSINRSSFSSAPHPDAHDRRGMPGDDLVR